MILSKLLGVSIPVHKIDSPLSVIALKCDRRMRRILLSTFSSKLPHQRLYLSVLVQAAQWLSTVEATGGIVDRVSASIHYSLYKYRYINITPIASQDEFVSVQSFPNPPSSPQAFSSSSSKVHFTMARLSLFVTVSAIAVASLASLSQAHNYVVKPLAEFKSGTPGYGNWVAEFSPPWSGDVSTGAKFTALAKKKGVTSVRSFIEKRGPDCGYSNPKAKAKAIPSDGKVTLFRSMDHPGPCELWIDNKMVYHNDDCKAAFGGATPGFKVNFSSCKGSCMLRFYWLGLQDKGQRMQSYKNCIPLSSNSKLRSRSMDEYDFNDLNSNEQ